MLCPEVCNFKAPETNLIKKTFSFNENKHLDIIQDLTYNHLVTVFLPDSLQVPESLNQVLSNDCDYYKIRNINLSEFVKRSFLQFVNNGFLYALSIGTRIDCDNCISITPSGFLILSLTKATYQSLGLEGQVSHFEKLTSTRYIVKINLKSLKDNQRIKTSLEKLSCDVIITWDPQIKSICPSSLAKYFYDLKYQVTLCETKRKSHVLYNSKVPSPTYENQDEFIEWLGIASLEANLIDDATVDFVSTYETPEPCKEVGQLRIIQWRGFFTANQIIKLYDELRRFLEVKRCDWIALYTQGFSDSPVAWKEEEHHFYTNGDNSYTLILTDQITIIQHKCSQKRYKNKTK